MASLHAGQGDEPIFQQETLGDVLVLSVIEDPTTANYASKQNEYNRLYRMLSEASRTHLLFDLHCCRILDSVTIGILVSLTNVCRSGGGESAISGLSEDVNGDARSADAPAAGQQASDVADVRNSRRRTGGPPALTASRIRGGFKGSPVSPSSPAFACPFLWSGASPHRLDHLHSNAGKSALPLQFAESG